MALISHYIHSFVCDVINHPFPAGLDYEEIIASIFQLFELDAIIITIYSLSQLLSPSKRTPLCIQCNGNGFTYL